MDRQPTESRANNGESIGAAFEKALELALEERARAQADRTYADSRYAELTAVIQSLLPLVPAECRAAHALELAAENVPVSGHATVAYRNVIQLFAVESKREWTAPDMQEALRRKGVESELKPIHNAFNYLAREGRIRRISRGRYYVPEYGFGIETSDDLLGDGK